MSQVVFKIKICNQKSDHNMIIKISKVANPILNGTWTPSSSFQAMKEQTSKQQSSPLRADEEPEASGGVLGGGRPPETRLHRLFWSQRLAWALAFHAYSNDPSACGFSGTRRYTEGHSRHVRQEFLQTDLSFSMYWETPSTLLSFRVCQQALDSMEEQSKGERRLSGQYGDSSLGGKPSPENCVCVGATEREDWVYFMSLTHMQGQTSSFKVLPMGRPSNHMQKAWIQLESVLTHTHTHLRHTPNTRESDSLCIWNITVYAKQLILYETVWLICKVTVNFCMTPL